LNIRKYFGLVENFVSYFLFKVIDAIIPLIIIPYLFKVVGIENYGIYAFAYALIFYLQNIIQFGFLLSAVRTIAVIRDNKKKLSKVYNNVFTTQVYFFILTMFLLVLLIVLVPKIGEHYIIYCFFSLLLIGELFSPMWFFLGVEKMRFITIVNVISKSAFAILCFVLIKEESDYIYISLYHATGYIVSGIIAQIIIYKQFGIRFRFAQFHEVKQTIKKAWSSFLTLISPTIYHNTSIFLVGIFGVPSHVGFMQIGSKASGAFGVVNTIMTSVLYPFLNRNKSAINITRYVFIAFGILLSLSMYFFADVLINLWLNRMDRQSESFEIIRVVKYLSPSPFLASMISAFGVNGLMIYKKDKLYSNIIIIGSFLGLVAGLILIPRYHYIGGAITIIFALSVKALLSCFYLIKTMRKQKQI